MNRTFRARAGIEDFNAHMDFLMAEALRVHALGMEAHTARKHAGAQYERLYAEMQGIVEEMTRTRKAGERLFS